MTVKSFIGFGFGYVAHALAARLLQSSPASSPDWSVTGTHRNLSVANNAEAFVQIEAFPGSWTPRGDETTWLISIPPDDEGCPVFRAFADKADNVSWIGYLSSTGVYGDLGGGWAFEDIPTNAQSREAKRRVIAENQWRDKGAHLFRLPGIYGPGRSAFDRLRSGRARRIIKPGQVFSRAHVDDIADVLVRSIARPNPGRIYNIADDKPAPAQDVISYAAHLIGMDPPPEIAFEDANLPDAAQRFYAECKRLPNSRIKAELGWRPAFSDYKSGLVSILEAEKLMD